MGLQCLWIPWSCGVPGFHDGVTCLRSGLWSSSVSDRDVAFPAFGGFDYWPSCGVPCLRLTLWASACVGLGGCPSFSRVGPAPSPWVPLLWTWLVWVGFHRVPSPLSSFGMWSPFRVNSVFLSLLNANEGFHWRWFLFRCSLPFRGSVVGFPTSSVGLLGLLVAGDHAFTWLVTVLASTLSSPGFLYCLARSIRCAALLYLWLCAHSLLGHGIPRLLACPSPFNRV